MLNLIKCLLIFVTTQYAHGDLQLNEDSDNLYVSNAAACIEISKKTGNITQISLHNHKLLSNPFRVKTFTGDYLDSVVSYSYTIPKADSCVINFYLEDSSTIINKKYCINYQSIYWEICGYKKTGSPKSIGFEFILPLVEKMNRIFVPDDNQSKELESQINLTYVYRKNIYIPLLVIYHTLQNYGLGIAAPFETSKPGMSYILEHENIKVQYNNMRRSEQDTVKVGLYLIPNEGDWRSSLHFLVNRYPLYFNSQAQSTLLDDGWFYLANPSTKVNRIVQIKNADVTSIEMHGYFPFYGLYTPEQQQWNSIRDSDNMSLTEWQNNVSENELGYDMLNRIIDKWHAYSIQVYLYFQSFEAWHQYAKKYFPEDVARDRNGNLLRAWKFTNLMNPDPTGKWGRHIIKQAKDLCEKYPSIDGIFYDRMDYSNYDFAHDDGLTMIDDQPAYMLGFGQERINKILFDLFHKSKKAIWGNIPTSIEVCKGLDGIMAEGSLRNLYKIQYLGLARPIIYYPYDRTEKQTEEKLKNALLCGAFPSITLGGDKCQTLDLKYKPLFNLLKGRTWFLNAHSVEIPTGFKSNIFKTPEGDYVVVVISPEKSQLVYHPFEYEIPVTINVPDANEINNAYLLSGDWSGINELPFKKKKGSIHIDLPQHLSSSLIYLTKKSKHDVVRLSSTILIKGQSNELIFKVYNRSADNNPVFKIATPWFDKTKKVLSDIVKFQTMVPDGIKGEVEITVNYNGKDYKYTNWLVEPVSIVPKEDIFVQCRHGENIPFYCVNNLPTKTTVNLAGKLITGHGKIKAPKKIILKPRESREIDIFVESGNNGVIQLNMSTGEKTFTKTFPVKTGLSFSNNDLFHDDFKYGMKKWMIYRGEWQVSNNVAMAEGSSHFAFIQSNTWNDYVVEAKTVCRGSNNPVIDWLKCYIFFRLQDEKNFYRFGIHGDAGVIDLYKCVNGKWGKLSSSVFMPKKDKWYALRIQVRGTKITGFLNGHKILEANDGTFPSGGIGIGVLEDAMRCEYKDIVVKKF